MAPDQQWALLPDDVLVDVLRRLAPRYLAACRSVCAAWRAAIDARGMLLEAKEPLPLTLAGILIKFHGGFDFYITELFSRPSTGSPSTSTITGKHDYLPQDKVTRDSEREHSWSIVRGHCNGLLLLDGYVLNPATRRLDPLPPHPSLPDKMHCLPHECLAYDPTISPHYEVILFPRFCSYRKKAELDPTIEQSEWPPAQWMLHVFSSRTGSWEERTFVREGEAAGTIADMRLIFGSECNAVYLGGLLYIHYCESGFVLRISLSSDSKCQVIKFPPGITWTRYPQFSLGRSEKGVYCASIQQYRLQVWTLNKYCCTMEWVMKHDRDLLPLLKRAGFEYVGSHQKDRQKVCGPWILQDINYHYDNGEAVVEEESEWSSEEESEWTSEEDNVEALEEDGIESIILEENKANNMEAFIEEESEWSSEEDDAVEALVEDEIQCSLLEANKANNMEALVEEEFEWNSEASVDEKLEWNSDNEDRDAKPYDKYIGILGFHPYKEIVFLSESIKTGLAFHLNSSKIEDLGNIYPKRYHEQLLNEQFIESSYP